MSELDEVVADFQTKALVAYYTDLKTNKCVGKERARAYTEAIETINKKFKTHYKSLNLERIAAEADSMTGFILAQPLME